MTYEDKATRLITIINTLANNDTVAKGAYTMFDPFELESDPDVETPYVPNGHVVYSDLEWTFGVIHDKIDESTEYTSLAKEGLALLEDIMKNRQVYDKHNRYDRGTRLGLAHSGVENMLYAGWLRHIAFVHEGIYIWDTKDFEEMYDWMDRTHYIEMMLNFYRVKCTFLEGRGDERTKIVFTWLSSLMSADDYPKYSRYLLSASMLALGPLPTEMGAVLGGTAKNELTYLANLSSKRKYKPLQSIMRTRQ